MGLDYLSTIDADTQRIQAALAARPDGAIPWSDAWTVQACAQHVGMVHHWVARVVAGRPTADFGARAELTVPELDDPGLDGWVAEGAASMLEQLRTTDAGEPCWSWWPDDPSVGFWQRRMAQETLVHRWDIELGAGGEVAPFDPAMAADGIDEFLDAFVGVARLIHTAPGAGESAHIHCTDVDGEWLIAFPAAGERVLTREHAKGDIAMRGPAQGLLLHLWGRLDAAAAGIEVLGDESVAARWSELVPPM